jgi:hypothetical protein
MVLSGSIITGLKDFLLGSILKDFERSPLVFGERKELFGTGDRFVKALVGRRELPRAVFGVALNPNTDYAALPLCSGVLLFVLSMIK